MYMANKGNLYDALNKMIADDGDYATEENGVGFNGTDTVFAHSLHDQLQRHGKLSENQVKALSKMMRRYAKTQVQGYDLSYKNLPVTESKATAPKVAKVKNGFAISFKYDQMVVQKVKQIKGRQWNGETKQWIVPATKEAYEQVMGIFDDNVDIDAEIEDEFKPQVEHKAYELAELMSQLSDDAKTSVEYFARRHGQEMAINAALAHGATI
jgi:hypothetical protein